MYHIAGNFGEGLNLVIWQILGKTPIYFAVSIDHVLLSPNIMLTKFTRYTVDYIIVIWKFGVSSLWCAQPINNVDA